MEHTAWRAKGAQVAAQRMQEAAVRVPGAAPAFPAWGALEGAQPPRDAPIAEEMRPGRRLLDSGAEALPRRAPRRGPWRLPRNRRRARAGTLGEVLREQGGLYGLLRSSPHELAGVDGVGEAKAAAELGKRMASERGPERPVISSPQDADRLLRGRMAHLDRERFVVVLLDTKNAVVAIHTVSVGTLTSSLVHPREVFKPAVQASAAGIILAHNHPSGKTEPSREDREVTERIARAGKTLGIEVLDHLVVGDAFFSFKEHGLI